MIGNKMPTTSIIDKYPPGSFRPDIGPGSNSYGEGKSGLQPRGMRENKNNQLFEKYMNRQNKGKLDGHSQQNSAMNIDQSGGGGESGSFALPSLTSP